MNPPQFFCLEHRPKPHEIQQGYGLTPAFEYRKCAHCQEQARVELASKPLDYPNLTTA